MSLAIEKILQEKGIAYRVLPLREAAYTVSDVVRYSKEAVNPEEICKTIILKGKKTGKMLAVFLQGTDRINFAKARQVFGEGMSIAADKEVQEAAGVEAGAVCPFLVRVPLFVDRNVMKLGQVNCGSGDLLFGLEFQIQDLAKGMPHAIVDISKETE